jgi:hypothetical protein
VGSGRVFDAAGLPLTSFGNGGRAVLDDPDERSASLGRDRFRRMGRIVAGGLVVTTSMHAKVRWLRSDGERSLSFDAQGDDGADDTPLGSTLALVIDAQDRVVVGGSEAHTGGTAFYPSRPAIGAVFARRGADRRQRRARPDVWPQRQRCPSGHGTGCVFRFRR